MQEYREIILETEYKTSQRVVVATLLGHAIFAAEQHALCHLANLHLFVGGALIDVVSVASEIGTVASMMHNILLQDALWDNPLRIDLHPLYLAAQQGCLRLPGTTDDAHVQQAVVAIGIEMIGRDVDNDALARLWNRTTQTPTGALHIAQDALSLFCSSIVLQHAFQLVVELILRFDGAQILSNAVVDNLINDCQVVVGRSLFHIHVEESTIAHDARVITRLFLFFVEVIEDA